MSTFRITIFSFFLLFVIAIDVAFAQNSGDKLKLGFSFSSGYSERVLATKDKSRNEAESGMFSYEIGIKGRFQFNPMIGLSSGIIYSNYGYKIDQSGWDYIYFGNQIDPTTGIIYQSQSGSPTGNIAEYSFSYIEIPLIFNLYLGESRMKFYAEAGVSLGFLTSKKFMYFIEGIDDTYLYDFNSINLFINPSIGLLYEIKSRLDLEFGPEFKYGLIEINEAPNSAKLMSYGFKIGLLYGM